VRVDGHDQAAILAAADAARKSDKPSLIACRTTIGFGAPKKAGTAKAHGEALGAEEIAGARKALNWPYEPFVIPDDILSAWRSAGSRGLKDHEAWNAKVAAMPAATRDEFLRRLRGDLPAALGGAVAEMKRKLADDRTAIATRKASEAALKVLAPVVPELVLGSADLTGSNNNKVDSTPAISPGNYAGRFIHWGVREHGMAAAVNGMSLHSGMIPSGATFLVFTDYCRPSLRLAALMRIRAIHVMTHDSIGLGEDGPTHQPVEHLASLRAIPNMYVFRPADHTETVECWQLALENKGAPSILALSRQNLPALRTTYVEENLCAKGAYELLPAQGKAQVSIFATGSEVSLAVEARDLLKEAGVQARVVSIPCMDLFFDLSEAERQAIIGDAPVKVAVEAAIRQGWDAIIGSDGIFVGMHSFGESGPYKKVYEHFGITARAVADQALAGVRAKAN
jgi:transketolase